jgi:hypothetical protein
MSNYLSYLAARQYSQLEVLRPRLSSRFEPLAGSPGPHFEPNINLDLFGESTPVTPDEPSPVWATPVVLHPAPDNHSVMGKPSEDRAVLTPLSLVDRSYADPPSGSPRREQESITPVTTSLASIADLLGTNASWPKPLARAWQPGEIDSRSPQVERQISGPDLVPSTTHPWQAAPDVSPSPERPLSSVLLGAPTRAARITAHTQIAKQLEPANLVKQPDAAEVSVSTQSETNIRITIGRIEVRAIAAPAPAPSPTKPASPKLSLDDYLSSRRGGKP